MDIEGRLALVTGASSGIGRATALALARRGARLMVTARNREALRAVAEATGAERLVADLALAGDVDRVAEWASGADVLVNNAGFGWAGPLATMDPTLAEEMLHVNVLAPLRLITALVPRMVERGRGHVVNVASILGHFGVQQEAAYASTKAALASLSESLRHEVAGTGVRVTVVSPGAVRTAFFEREGRPYDRGFPRPIRPERVARAIVRAIERERDDVFVPWWMAFPAWLHGTWPSLFRRLAGRFA